MSNFLHQFHLFWIYRALKGSMRPGFGQHQFENLSDWLIEFGGCTIIFSFAILGELSRQQALDSYILSLVSWMFTNINHLKSKRAKIKELSSLNSFIFVYYCLFCLLLEYLKYLLFNEISSLRSFRVVIFYFALYLGKPYAAVLPFYSKTEAWFLKPSFWSLFSEALFVGDRFQAVGFNLRAVGNLR